MSAPPHAPAEWQTCRRAALTAHAFSHRTFPATRSIRHIVLPLMHSTSLEQFTPTINAAVSRLIGILTDAAASKREVDIHALFGRLTLDVIAVVVGGKPAGAQRELDAPPPPLVAECAKVFAYFEPVTGSGIVNDAYGAAMAFLPSMLHPLMRALAKRWPSRGVVELETADARVRQASVDLLREHKASGAAAPSTPPTLVSVLCAATMKYMGGRPMRDIEILSLMHTFLCVRCPWPGKVHCALTSNCVLPAPNHTTRLTASPATRRRRARRRTRSTSWRVMQRPPGCSAQKLMPSQRSPTGASPPALTSRTTSRTPPRASTSLCGAHAWR